MEEIYKRYSQIVFHFLYARCGDGELAEDLMQETFLKALEAIDTFDGSCKMSTWLCQIGKHLLYQHWEKSNRAKLEMLEEEMKASNDTEKEVMFKMELTDVWDILQTLPTDMRKVIELRALSDMSYKEIGGMLGKSENWARVTFYRGKMILIREAGYGKDEM
ncbi:MAG: sigma-70 family RNA polymerase sigma factor [Lachnospiraceae bacterium]|nr:sigma-70 family RNA polymerase sigma factor [Lachnospiraceae bacterium]